MSNLTPLAAIPESLVHYNRARLAEEVSQGIYDLMRTYKLNRSKLATLLGTERSRVSKMLKGTHNFELKTLADVYLVLKRYPHLSLGRNPELRFPEDETTADARTMQVFLHSFVASSPWETEGETNYGHATIQASPHPFTTSRVGWRSPTRPERRITRVFGTEGNTVVGGSLTGYATGTSDDVGGLTPLYAHE